MLILDAPFVHQLLEAYVSKLLALSYGVASVDVHSADPTDHFVHCFTHRRAICCVTAGCWLIWPILAFVLPQDAAKALKIFF